MTVLRLGVGWLLASCTFPTTQTVIEVQADTVVRQRATEIRIEVSDSLGNALRAPIVVTPRSTDFVGFPIRIPVTARRGEDTRSFGLRVTAIEAMPLADGSVNTSTLATNQIRTGFARGRVLRATLWLLTGCRCSENERCVPDENDDRVPECKPVEVDVRAEVDAGLDTTPANDAAADASTGDVTLVTPPTCTNTEHVCGGRCVSNFSPNYCGATSCTACPVPENAIEATCSATGCGFVCQTNYNECRGACVNFASDRRHCGSCGNACAGAQLCVNRQCVEPPQCTSDAGCTTAGTYCNLSSNRCESGCNDASDCSVATEVCNTSSHQCDCTATHHRCSQTGNSCVPLMQVNACGASCTACPTPSGATATCNGSSCDFACSSGIRCGSSCSVCPTGANIATTGCSAEACIVLTCADGFTRNAANSACVAQASGTLRWVERTNIRAPTIRASELAYDSTRQRVVLFGGSNNLQRHDDTWEWDGTSMRWSQITTTNPPPARFSHAMAYDSHRQRVVLFGGWLVSWPLNDTWKWDGARMQWSQVATTNPPPARFSHAMAYDSNRQRVVLFGGSNENRVSLNDTWEWEGARMMWTQIPATNPPPARWGHALAYDSNRQRVVLFGDDSSQQLNDTWEWDGVQMTWTQIPVTNPPPARWGSGMAYDSSPSASCFLVAAAAPSAWVTHGSSVSNEPNAEQASF